MTYNQYKAYMGLVQELKEIEARAYASSLVIDDYRRFGVKRPEDLEAFIDADGVLRVESRSERLVRENRKWALEAASIMISKEVLEYKGDDFQIPIISLENLRNYIVLGEDWEPINIAEDISKLGLTIK